jgi:radical SAM-linked protein
VAEGFRCRIEYGKVGRLRWLSHLEVMRACERAVRRASLPYSVTKGFSPKMKVAFGPALPVGTAGEHEYFDVWLTSYLPAHAVLEGLAGASPADLAPLAVRYVAESEPSLSAAVSVATYEVVVEVPAMGRGGLEEALSDVVRAGSLTVEHKGKTKVFDLARALPEEPRVGEKDGGHVAFVTTRIGPEGSLRPEALVHEALTRAGLQGTPSAVTRTGLFIEKGTERVRPID